MLRSLSFGIITKVSTFPLRALIPDSADFALFLPSNVNGFVTTPTVKRPNSFATSAITGAAPVPVPPPIPAVINTMSAPSRASLISSIDSSAACSPTSGFAPAPSPLVIFSPSCTFVSASEFLSACLSVLNTKNSTPLTPASIILFTALFPPPPTPTTLILAKSSWSISNSNINILLVY